MAKWLRRILEFLLATTLVSVGVLGEFHEVLHRIGIEIHDPGPITLRIVCLLAIALGLERFTQFAHFDHNFKSLHQQLNVLQAAIQQQFPAYIIEGYDNVYDEDIKLIRTSESSIRTLAFANKPVAPERFFYALVEHLKQHKSVTFHVTVAVDLSRATEEIWKIIDKRDAIHHEQGIAQRFRLTILNTTKPVGFDLIVIDDKHCAMSLSVVPRPDEDKQIAIHFGEHAAVKRIRAWFENLEPQLLSVEEARNEWTKRHRNRRKMESEQS
jgi:hypothetical protein